ncbi:DUF2182 domain-containing protein [Xanthobacter flavus]|uniref:DUF2182 domain-containing protein n=1 Tax=Xanthobacter flavus TaxID=281 RepID=UPI001AE74B13|nr:DUF2182 domain-containing protein [Xanthobacter flavus]MBP2150854.1 putative metal-binding membrane protein [Xanthobacter flavus]
MLTFPERAVIAAALAFVTLSAWLGSWAITAGMEAIDPTFLAQLCARPWSAADFANAFLMWNAMMVAMMLPSAAPMIDAFATIAKRRRARRDPYVPTLVFVLGYLAVWGGFSLAGATGHWLMANAGLVGPDMAISNRLLSGGVLVLAGLYQLTSVKQACLTHCRSPSGFILSEWREGYRGSMVMGFRHGLYCVGCCWALMLLMLVVSMMDLRWAAALAVYVAAEKLLPNGTLLSKVAGFCAVALGIGLFLVELVPALSQALR